jgi:thiosulfate dehydrogenase [quinone] large subunit
MTTAEAASPTTRQTLRAQPLRALGIGFAVFIRLFMGLFHFAAGINKFRKGWLWSDLPHQIFAERLTQIPAESFGALFLTTFAQPLYPAVAFVVVVGEIVFGACLLLGLASRWAGGYALWLIVMIGIGGYYDHSLIPLALMCMVIIATPSGHWLGLDRRLHARFPQAIWFR